MLSVIAGFFSYLYWYIRPLVKWFLRRTTRLCELQRICYGEEFGFNRTNKIAWSIDLSLVREIMSAREQLYKLASEGRFSGRCGKSLVDYTVRLTLHIKDINPEIHIPFIKNYRCCLYQIYGCRQLIYEVEKLRKIQYLSENLEHEQKLLQLWSLLKPGEVLNSRISRQWGEIGFQGDDPKTDFRGMGLLGLENLLYFASEYNDAARHVLLHSKHPVYGYSFAIVGINLTSMALQLLKDQRLVVHFYNTIPDKPLMKDFHNVYCYLFYEFDRFWLAEKPRDIMEFGRIRAKFEEEVRQKLQNPQAKLKLGFLIETL